MGKSSKKSDAKVAVAAPVANVKGAKKGAKRDAEDALEKLASAKKQKKEVEVKKKVPPPKKEESCSSEEDDSSSEEEKPAVSKKIPGAAVNKSDSSDDSSESENDSSEDDKVAKPVTKAKNTLTASKVVPTNSLKKKEESSESESGDSSESESDSDSDKKKVGAAKPLPSAKGTNGLKKNEESGESESSDDSESESDSDSDKKAPASTGAGKPIAKALKKESSSDEDEDDSSDDEPPKAPKIIANKTTPKPKVEESSDDSSDENEEEPQKKKSKVEAPLPSNAGKANKKDSSSDEEDDSEEGSEESSGEESEDEKAVNTPKKDSDVKMKDAPSSGVEKKEHKTPSQNQTSGSKTLFVGNLSFNAERGDVEEFFGQAGEVVSVRLATSEVGSFRGFGHVEFATESDALKALEMNGQDLLGRAVKLDIAKERGTYTPETGSSFQKGGPRQGQSIFVKGFDKSFSEDEIRSSLQDHFGSCGQISRLSIPPDFETGAPKGIAYIDFKDKDAVSQALELNGSDLGGYTLTVDEAKPRGVSRDGGWSGGRSGGRGDNGGRGGRFGGRRGGRDGGGRGGRGRGGGSRGGRGTPNRQSFTAASTGKKTTFADD